MATVIAREFIHSCMGTTKNDGDGIVIKERLYMDDGTHVPNIRVIRNPERPFWTTKPGRRTYDQKKEWEERDALDEWRVANHMLPIAAYRALNNGRTPNRRVSFRDVQNSPYLYGADISVECLLKHDYIQKFLASGASPVNPTCGFFDTETSVQEHNYKELLCATVTHENRVYTAVQRKFMFTTDGKGNKIPATIEQLQELSASVLQGENEKHGFVYEYFVGESELELLIWIASRINTNMTDFIGVWNLDYDYNVIADVCKKFNYPITNIFCHPSVPEDLHYLNYKYDTSKVQHNSRKWHRLATTGTAQWIDYMCSYSRLRTAMGLANSYRLDAILKDNGIGGKLHFDNLPDIDGVEQTEWHRRMQTLYPLHYVVYNQYDVIGLQLMEWKIRDFVGLHAQMKHSSFMHFASQTRRAADDLYFKCLSANKVIGTPASDMTGEYDHLIPAVGGAVLRPGRIDRRWVGLLPYDDAPTLVSGICVFVSDVDFSQHYPVMAMVNNISRATKRSTMLARDDFNADQITTFHSLMLSIDSNAVEIGTTFFNLPGFTEMEMELHALDGRESIH